jgi:hypothetical protein
VAVKENNALLAACKFLNDFDAFMKESLKYNFGIIHGGNDSAIPIAELLLEGTIFFPECEKELKQTIAKKFPNTEISFSDFGFEGADFPENKLYHNLIKRVQCRDSLFSSPCDARLYKKYGIPAIIFGPGNLEQAHAVDEHIALQDVKEYIQTVADALWEYLKI